METIEHELKQTGGEWYTRRSNNAYLDNNYAAEVVAKVQGQRGEGEVVLCRVTTPNSHADSYERKAQAHANASLFAASRLLLLGAMKSLSAHAAGGVACACDGCVMLMEAVALATKRP